MKFCMHRKIGMSGAFPEFRIDRGRFISHDCAIMQLLVYER